MAKESLPEIEERSLHCVCHSHLPVPLQLPVNNSILRLITSAQVYLKSHPQRHHVLEIDLFIGIPFLTESETGHLYVYEFSESLIDPSDNPPAWKLRKKIRIWRDRTINIFWEMESFFKRVHLTCVLTVDGFRGTFSRCIIPVLPNETEVCSSLVQHMNREVQFHTRLYVHEYGKESFDGCLSCETMEWMAKDQRCKMGKAVERKGECLTHPTDDPAPDHDSHVSPFGLPKPKIDVIEQKEMRWEFFPADLIEKMPQRGEITIRISADLNFENEIHPFCRWNLFVCYHRLSCQTVRKWRDHSFESAAQGIEDSAMEQYCNHENKWINLTNGLKLRAKTAVIRLINFPLNESFHFVACISSLHGRSQYSECKRVLTLCNKANEQLKSFV